MPWRGGGHADGEVAGDFFLLMDQGFGGKRKHIRGFVQAAELAVEAADGLVGGEEDGDVAAQPDGGLGSSEKERKSARRG